MDSFDVLDCLRGFRQFDEVSFVKKMVKVRKALGMKRCDLARVLGVETHLLAHIEQRFRGNGLCFLMVLDFYRSVGVDLNLLFADADYPADGPNGLAQIKRGAVFKRALEVASAGAKGANDKK